MSQMYRVQIKETVCITTESKDELKRTISLQQILAREEMEDIFKELLQQKGLQKDGEIYRLDVQGVELSIDTNATNARGEKTIVSTLRLSKEREDMVEVSIEEMVDLDFVKKSEAHDVVRNRVDVDNHTSKQRKELQSALDSELVEELQEAAEKTEELLHEILQETYAEALKRKAAQIGRVLEQSESTDENGSYELKIRIEL